MTVFVLNKMGDKFGLSDVCPPLYSPGGWCKTLTPGTMKRVEAPDQVMFEFIAFFIRFLTMYLLYTFILFKISKIGGSFYISRIRAGDFALNQVKRWRLFCAAIGLPTL